MITQGKNEVGEQIYFLLVSQIIFATFYLLLAYCAARKIAVRTISKTIE